MCINQFAVRTREPGRALALPIPGRPRQLIRRLMARMRKPPPSLMCLEASSTSRSDSSNRPAATGNSRSPAIALTMRDVAGQVA